MKLLKQIIKTAITAVVSITLLSSFTTPIDTVVAKEKKEVVSYSGEKKFKAAKKIVVEIDYVAKKNREIAVELRDKNNKWLGNAKVAIKKGKGTAKVTIKLKSQLKKGKGYLLKYMIRPVGTSWKEKIAGGAAKDLVVY